MRFDEDEVMQLMDKSRNIYSILYAARELASAVTSSDTQVSHLIRLVFHAEAQMEDLVAGSIRAIDSADRVSAPLVAVR